MSVYEIVYVSTIPMLIASIYFFNLSFFEKNDKTTIKERLSYGLYFLLIIVLFLTINIPIINLVANIISFFIISLNYKSNLLKKIIVSILIFSVQISIELIVFSLFSYTNISALEKIENNSIVGMFVLRIVTLLVSYLFFKFNRYKNKYYSIPIYYYMIHFLVLIGTLYLFLNSLEVENISTSKLIISSVILCLVNVMIIWIDAIIFKFLTYSVENRLMKIQNLAYENQAEIVNQSIKSMNAYKHDIKNHISVLNEIYASGEINQAKDYSNKVILELDKNDISKSNNFVIDSIVNLKLSNDSVKDIDYKLSLDVPKDMNVSAFDLTTILCNIFDNALFALKKVETKDKKLFVLMSVEKENLVIVIENTHNNDIKYNNGKFKTTKENSLESGYGIENVKRVVETYNGFVDIEFDKHKFCISVFLPI